ncbi:MAG: RluA family pseudouridine synthase, partial [Tannerella sp.]|jgi:23S rRNA pseudouridine1911/1915/1917 synthase|nr:RluA family pseudouridine synthase [Tannerella sp.]
MDFLSALMAQSSRNKVKGLLRHGLVSVDGVSTTRYDYPLQPGQEVRINKKSGPAFGNRQLQLVYEDDYLLVVNKSEGLLSISTEREQEHTARSILDEYLRRSGLRHGVYVVHRLDRDTSGLMMFCKSEEAQTELRSHWKEMVFDRRYVAVVNGSMEKDEGSIHSWLTDHKLYVSSSPYDDGGLESLTHYRCIRRGGGYSLLELRLDTGRRNQIRVHMQTIGHPVLGDGRYGDDDTPDPLGRLALHAFKLCFYHPITRQVLSFETPYPPSFKSICF